MPTSAVKLSDRRDAREGLAETQEAREEACAEDAQGATDRKARRSETCQPGARRLSERPHTKTGRRSTKLELQVRACEAVAEVTDQQRGPGSAPAP